MGIVSTSYQDPVEFSYGAFRTSNPIARAMRPDKELPEQGMDPIARLRYRQMALDELLAESDPTDFIGIGLIREEKAQIDNQIERLQSSLHSAIGEQNAAGMGVAAQTAEQLWGQELAGLNRRMENPPFGAEREGGSVTSPWGQYGAFMPNTGYIGTRGGEVSPYQGSSPAMMDWMRGVSTPQGLRPLVGDFALDPIQQQQAALWQTYTEYGTPKTIEDWLQIKPNAALIAEQWLQKSNKVRPGQQARATDWIAASAR